MQSNYIPWRGYFQLIARADTCFFYDDVQYTKNDWRNRNRILGPNGLFWITVPVEKDAVNGKISEALITNSSWQKKHFKTTKTYILVNGSFIYFNLTRKTSVCSHSNVKDYLFHLSTFDSFPISQNDSRV